MPKTRKPFLTFLLILSIVLLSNGLQLLKSQYFPTSPQEIPVFSPHLPGPANIAHRGASGSYPENTILAFEKALEFGADAIEMDIWLTADNKPVVIHDRTVTRTTDGQGPVRNFTLEELQKLDAGYNFAPDQGYPFRGKGIKIPSLKEVIEKFNDVILMIEIKKPGPQSAYEVAKLIQETGAKDRVLLGSMNTTTLRMFRRLLPEIPTVATITEFRRFYFLSHLGIAGFFNWNFDGFFVPPNEEGFPVLTIPFRTAARAQGLPIFVWTINEPVRMERFLEMELDGIVTDFPEILQPKIISH